MNESQIRASETSLMVGRIAGLARLGHLTADQRIGVSLAQKVLEERERELRTRLTPPAEPHAETQDGGA